MLFIEISPIKCAKIHLQNEEKEEEDLWSFFRHVFFAFFHKFPFKF